MSDRTCSIDGCERQTNRLGLCPVHYAKTRGDCKVDGCLAGYTARGYCQTHYWQARRSGELQKATRPTPEARFWAKVEKTDTCWNWTANVLDDGYGMFCYRSKNVLAHRHAYRMAHGEIPDWMHVDHTCFNRRCVRLDHLRLTTPKQNAENRSGAQRTSRSGVRGVWLKKSRNRWYASVAHHGKRIFVGEFRELADAAEAVRLKRIELFTHNDADRREPFL